MSDFPSHEWFSRLAEGATADPEAFERLGFADLRLVVAVADGDDVRRFGIVLDGYDVEFAGEITDVDAFAADATVSGPLAVWSEMAENIARNGRADNEHTLNRLTMAGDPLQVEAGDAMGHDKFFRYAETLQVLFDGTGRDRIAA